MEYGIWSLPPMARGRSLAAHSGNAPALAMMLLPHSRGASGTVDSKGYSSKCLVIDSANFALTGFSEVSA